MDAFLFFICMVLLGLLCIGAIAGTVAVFMYVNPVLGVLTGIGALIVCGVAFAAVDEIL